MLRKRIATSIPNALRRHRLGQWSNQSESVLADVEVEGHPKSFSIQRPQTSTFRGGRFRLFIYQLLELEPGQEEEG